MAAFKYRVSVKTEGKKMDKREVSSGFFLLFACMKTAHNKEATLSTKEIQCRHKAVYKNIPFTTLKHF